MRRCKQVLLRLLGALAAVLVFARCGDEDVPAPPDSDVSDVTEESSADAWPDTDDAGGDCGDGCGEVCGDGSCVAPENLESCPLDCNPAPIFWHDPLSGVLLTFPDDYFTMADPDTATGLRVRLTPETLPVGYASMPRQLGALYDELSLLDGFGTSAGIVLRFTHPLDPDSIDSGEATVDPDSAVFLGVIDGLSLRRIPVEVLLLGAGATLVLRPMQPLPPASRAVAGVTTAAVGLDDRPAAPNRVLRALLEGTAQPPLDRMVGRFAEATSALVAAGWIGSTADIAAMTVFTTQSAIEESQGIAADIRARVHTVGERLGCEDDGPIRHCVARFAAGHYRDAEGHVAVGSDGGPSSTYDLLASIYLPVTSPRSPPYPTLIYGHGIGDDRTQARWVAQAVSELGLAVVSIDAPEHGEHPVRQSQDDLVSVVDFLGISPTGEFQVARMRDNWRQATYDKLALIELIRGGLDADGDGMVDVDASRLGYFGVSFGAVMGPELLALSPDLHMAVLNVGGARITDIVQFSSFAEPLVLLFRPAGMSDDDVARLYPLIQTLVEPGDGANYAPYVLGGQLESGSPTQVLMVMAIDDQIVPEPSNAMLARSLGLPHIPPVIRPVGVVPVEESTPVSGNLATGGTGGLVQIDWVPTGDGWVRSNHDNVAGSAVARELWMRFLETTFEEGVGEIIDPYAALGLERPVE